MEVSITWWHNALPLLTHKKSRPGEKTIISIQHVQYVIEVLLWDMQHGELVCRIGNSPYRWQRMPSSQSGTISWYSHHHKTVIALQLKPPLRSHLAPRQSLSPAPTICSPLAGRVIRVAHLQGTFIKAYTTLITIEAMKMENEIRAPHDGFIENIFIKSQDVVELGQPLITLIRKDYDDEQNKENHYGEAPISHR